MTIQARQSLSHMKNCSKCGQSKHLTEFHRKASSKDGHMPYCKPCNNAHVAAWQRTDTGKAKHGAIASAWQVDNKASHALSVGRWQQSPRGKAKRRAAWAKYNACKMQRTPPWLTNEQLAEIESFYKRAKELELQTNTPMHVDHIIPLQGETVSGLHVPWNLQVLPAPLNWSKGNKF
jgi:hypothetical protein